MLNELKKLETYPSGQNRQKSSVKEFLFVNSALKIQYYVLKNTLLQTAFSVILPIRTSQNLTKII